eukprot:scaffold459_cov391-Prasinococcus_capsulatus_cf.AAC.2
MRAEARCRALEGKVQVMHRQLLKDTYSTAATAALRECRSELARAGAEARAECDTAQARLAQYSGTSPQPAYNIACAS